jgi:hypothetical protein
MPILMPTESRFPSARNSYSHPNGMSIHIDRNTQPHFEFADRSRVCRQKQASREPRTTANQGRKYHQLMQELLLLVDGNLSEIRELTRTELGSGDSHP